MNVSSMSSTQSLWKYQVNIQKQTTSLSSQATKSTNTDSAEELLAILQKARTPESQTENAVQSAPERAEGGRRMRIAGPPPGFMPGMDGAQKSEPKEFTKEDLANLKQAIEDGGKSASDGLSKLINAFDETDTDKNGKISKGEFQAFAKQKGISLPAMPQEGGGQGVPEMMGPPPSGRSGDQGFSKDDLKALKSSIDAGIKSLSDTLQKLMESFAQSDTDRSGGLSADELKAFAEKNGISLDSGSGKGHRKTDGPTKEDLTAIKKTLEDFGIAVPEKLTKMIDSFDDIDSNKDGKIGKNEFKAFDKSSETATNPQSASGATGTNASESPTSGSSENASVSQSKDFSRMLLQQMVKSYGQNTAGRYQSAMTESLTDMVA